MELNVSHLFMLCIMSVMLVNPAAFASCGSKVLCNPFFGLLVTRVSVTVAFELSAMTTYNELRRVTLVAFGDSNDLHGMLDRLPADPWAAEVRATLENRWRMIEDEAVDLKNYVDFMLDTLQTSIRNGVPAVAGQLVTLEATTKEDLVAERAARATATEQRRASRRVPPQRSGTPEAPPPQMQQSRWADMASDTPGASSSAAADTLGASSSALDTQLAPRLGQRAQAPFKAPPSPVMRPTSAGSVRELPVKRPPMPRVQPMPSLGMPTPLVSVAPVTPLVWLSPNASRQAMSARGEVPSGSGTQRAPAPWGTQSSTALPRDGGPMWWAGGRPAGWKIVMGDLPFDVTLEKAWASVHRDMLWNTKTFNYICL